MHLHAPDTLVSASHSPQDKPHTNDPASMADMILAIAEALQVRTLQPAQVTSAWKVFVPWAGSKPVVLWRGLVRWHSWQCKDLCLLSATIAENIHRCPLLRVLIAVTTDGIRPADWMPAPPGFRPNTGKVPYKLSEDHERFARAKHNEFEAAGVLTRHSKRSSRSSSISAAASSAFVVDKWKAPSTPQAVLARASWAATAPAEVRAFLGKKKTFNNNTNNCRFTISF